jgi:RNA polymerase Rpb1, domain 5
MNQVFGVYGIQVDPRHLSLTADYMTYTGLLQPFNRNAMNLSASPLQKMTFETSMTFARETIVNGKSPLYSALCITTSLISMPIQETRTTCDPHPPGL